MREIDNGTRKTVVESLRQGNPFEVPQEHAGAIPPEADKTTTYAYITREGGCGFLKLNPGADKPLVPGALTSLDDQGLQYEFVFVKPAPDGAEAK